MGGFSILGLLFLHLQLHAGGGRVVGPQGGGVRVVVGLHVRQEDRRLREVLLKGDDTPGVGQAVGGPGDFVAQRADGALARFPGDVVDRFLHVLVFVLLLLLEVVGKARGGDLRGPAADGVDLVLRGDRGQHHRDGVEQAAEAHVLVGGRAGKAARLDDGPVRQGGAAPYFSYISLYFFNYIAIILKVS